MEGLARETIKLLKDYDYRKKKGIEAKESLKRFSNKETAEKWCKLFEVLVNNDTEGYKKLQESTFDKKYYDDESARSHLEYSWKKGDCIRKVAEKFQVLPEDIINLNMITNSDYLQEGDIILIPERN